MNYASKQDTFRVGILQGLRSSIGREDNSMLGSSEKPPAGVDWSSTTNDQYYYTSNNNSGIPGSTGSVWEIEEEEDKDHKRRLGSVREVEDHQEENEITSSSLFSLDVQYENGNEDGRGRGRQDVDDGDEWVYVGVGKDDSSSVEALSWTLQKVKTTTTGVCLVHVFPEVHHIPSPLGKLPRSQVSPEQVESYIAQERGKRRDHLVKFLNMCIASKVKVDTVLIESDMVAKALLDLIPVLNMRKLVLGTSKSSFRKWKSRRGSGLVDQILHNAPESCEVNIICQGKEVKDQIISAGSASPSPRGAGGEASNINTKQLQVAVHNNANESFACMCFKSPRVT